MSNSLVKRLRDIAVVSLVIGILAGFFVPIYTDETGWRFQERAAFDGVDKLYSDVCGANTLARPPFFMWPVRYYSAIFNSAFADPFYIRLSGVLYALTFVALMLWLIRRIAASVWERAVSGTMAAGLLTLGMMPLVIVWSRPEQPILLCLLGALIIGANAVGATDKDTSGKAAWRRSLMLAALWAIAVSYHLKALFLLPVFGACLFYCARSREARIPKLASGALILAITAAGASYWVGRLGCPDEAALRSHFASNSVGALLSGVKTLEDAWTLTMHMLGNVKYFGYVMLLTPDPAPLSSWLPEGQISRPDAIRWYGALLFVWGVALVTGLYALVKSLRSALAQRRIDARLVLALTCIVSFMGWSATQNWSNVYETPFALSLALLAIILAVAAISMGERERATLNFMCGTLVGLGIVNLALLAVVWSPAMSRAWSQEGYIEDQFNSVSIHGYGKLKPQIMETARMCGIPEPDKAHAVLIDELTYFAYMKSHLPQHRLGSRGIWTGKYGDTITYLKSRKSDGILVGCQHLAPDLRARAKQNGEFCCLAPPDW